jgi:hypothetical protein
MRCTGAREALPRNTTLAIEEDAMFRYGFLVLGLVVGAACLFALWRTWRQSANDQSTPLMDYLLVWPLVFRTERQSRTPTRLGFVVLGIAVVVALFVVDRFVNVRRHG